jgi:hypothetical protein
MVTTAPGAPPAPGKTKKPELAKAQATYNNSEVIGSSKNDNDSITKSDFLEASELPDVNSTSLPGCNVTQLPPGATGRISYSFDAVSTSAHPYAYTRPRLTASARDLRGMLGKLICKDKSRRSITITLPQLSRLCGVSRNALTDSIWRLRGAGEILTTRVYLNPQRYMYEFTFPALASEATLAAAREQYVADHIEKDRRLELKAAAANAGRVHRSRFPSRRPRTVESASANPTNMGDSPIISHPVLGPENQAPTYRSTEVDIHHGSELQEPPSGADGNACGYDGPPGPEQGERTVSELAKKRPAKRQRLSPAVQADIAARKARELSEASAERMRADAHKPTEAVPSTREVPPAGPVAAAEKPQGLNLAAQDTLAALPVAKEDDEVTESPSPSLKASGEGTSFPVSLADAVAVQLVTPHVEPVAEVASSPAPPAPAAPRKGKSGTSFESLSFEVQAIVRSLVLIGIHRHKAVHLATSHPGRLIAKVLHDLKSQRGIRSAPGWVVRAIERGGYKAAGADQVDLETIRKTIRAREATEATKERAALADAENNLRHRVETLIHPTRRQAWEADAIAHLTRSERTLIEGVGKDNPVARATIWRHMEALAKTGRYQVESPPSNSL